MYLKEYKGRKIFNLLQKIILIFIRTYKLFISPVLLPACRFYPTCSEYAYQAIFSYGPFRGTMLAVKRILKCHPFHPGGIDPVP